MMHQQRMLPFDDSEGGASSEGALRLPSQPQGEDALPPPPNPYEERLEARRTRLEERAERAHGRSEAAYEASRRAVEHIPFGQPILVGHHSERGHRRDIARCHRAMDRSVAEARKAKELEEAASRVGKGGISSDDPEALQKLEEKLGRMEARRELMKKVNRQYRAGGWDAVVELSEGARERIKAAMARMPGPGDAPFPAYSFRNLGSNIRRVRERIETLRTESEREPNGAAQCEGFTVEEHKGDNRIRLVSDSKPDSEVRALLKANGFRWAPTVGAWQRQLNDAGRLAAERVRAELSQTKLVAEERPEQFLEEAEAEAPPAATLEWLRDHDRNEVIARIKHGLNARSDRTWSVTGGRGTAYGWLQIDAPPRRRTFTHRPTGEKEPDGLPIYSLVDAGKPGNLMGLDDRTELARLLGYKDESAIPHQGVNVPSGHDYYAEFIDRAEGREPSVVGVPYWD